MNTKAERERKFAKIFTSKMYNGYQCPLDDRFNAIGQLLTQLFVLIDQLGDKNDY